MKKILKYALALNFITSSLVSSSFIKELVKNDISITNVDTMSYNSINLDKISNKPNIIINSEFNKLSKNLKANEVSNSYLAEDGQITEIADVNLVSVAKYNFILNNKQYNGEVYANSNETTEKINETVNNIIDEINDGTYFEGHEVNSNKRLGTGIALDSQWKYVSETRITVTCSTQGEYFGEYTEWISLFKLQNDKLNENYYALFNEGFVKPSLYKTDYRTDGLEFTFEPTRSVPTTLRDYAPKVKNPSGTISYGLGATLGYGSDGATVGASISASYSTTFTSPRITDYGNMGNDYADIFFDYLEPYKNSGEFYNYNISQTYQCATFIFRTPSKEGNLDFRNNRTISITRDGFWSNKEAHFQRTGTISIDIKNNQVKFYI